MTTPTKEQIEEITKEYKKGNNSITNIAILKMGLIPETLNYFF
jgi:hypothetical protein